MGYTKGYTILILQNLLLLKSGNAPTCSAYWFAATEFPYWRRVSWKMNVTTWLGIFVSVLVLGSIHELGVDGCSARPVPAKYSRPQPDPIYYYVARENHPDTSVKGKALPGEVCNYDHRKLYTKESKSSVLEIEYDKFHAECVVEAESEASSTCEYVYDRRGFPIYLHEKEVKVNKHPEDRWHKYNKSGDTHIFTRIFFKKCVCPPKTSDDKTIYHNTWDADLKPPRPSCTTKSPADQKLGPGARGYNCQRAIKTEKDKEAHKPK